MYAVYVYQKYIKITDCSFKCIDYASEGQDISPTCAVLLLSRYCQEYNLVFLHVGYILNMLTTIALVIDGLT